jgi:putative ABC transport system permease protein
MANSLSQIGAVTAMNIRNIPERWASSLVAVVGIGSVTLVLIAVLSIAAGFQKALELSGSPDVAIILRSGSTNEMSSGFGLNQVTLTCRSAVSRRPRRCCASPSRSRKGA